MKTEFGNYTKMYGALDYTDATVLDIGADHGTTAEYFLARGARFVAACERNPQQFNRLRALAEGRPMAAYGAFDADIAPDLFEFYQPDIVKVDCEGCEAVLLTLPDELLRGPRAWVLETHSWQLYEDLTALFKRLGYRITMVCDWGDTPNRSGKLCKVWQAER